LEEICANGASTISQATGAVSDYAQQAAETFQETSKHAVEKVQQGYEETERLVRERPVESVALVFGVGVLVGVLTSLCLRSR